MVKKRQLSHENKEIVPFCTISSSYRIWRTLSSFRVLSTEKTGNTNNWKRHKPSQLNCLSR